MPCPIVFLAYVLLQNLEGNPRLGYYRWKWKNNFFLKTHSKPSPVFYLSTMRSSVRFLIQSNSPLSPSSTSRPQGTQGNSMIWVEPSLRLRPGYVPKPVWEHRSSQLFICSTVIFLPFCLVNLLLVSLFLNLVVIP